MAHVLLIKNKHYVLSDKTTLGSRLQSKPYSRSFKMTEKTTEQLQSQEMSKVGMAFMGFLMGLAAILGIWFVSDLIRIFPKMMG